jgi:hypothetical protein
MSQREQGQVQASVMALVTIPAIEERLRRLSAADLATVIDFVSFLAERRLTSEGMRAMVALEEVLRRDWESFAEEAAWVDL